MHILGIDYGKSKIGLALSTGVLAEPYSVLRFKSWPYVAAKIKEIVEKESIQKILVGVSEGLMAGESKKFAEDLSKEIPGVTIETFDETLTSHDAIERSIEAGVGRKKRKNLEDAYAATLMLQNYLDSQADK